MIDEQILGRAFSPDPVPQALLDLLTFDNGGEGWISEGFEFFVDEAQAGLKTYSEAEEFLSRFVEFSTADGTGSSYAIWRSEASLATDKCPVVVFGSEGGVHVVAENLGEWLRLLSFDVEPMVDENVSYYKDVDDYAPTDRIDEYRSWLPASCGLQPIDDPELVLGPARERWQESLDRLMRQYVEDY